MGGIPEGDGVVFAFDAEDGCGTDGVAAFVKAVFVRGEGPVAEGFGTFLAVVREDYLQGVRFVGVVVAQLGEGSLG